MFFFSTSIYLFIFVFKVFKYVFFSSCCCYHHSLFDSNKLDNLLLQKNIQFEIE